MRLELVNRTGAELNLEAESVERQLAFRLMGMGARTRSACIAFRRDGEPREKPSYRCLVRVDLAPCGHLSAECWGRSPQDALSESLAALAAG